MAEGYTPKDLADAGQMLNELLEVVTKQEGHLGGGKQSGLASQALQGLLNSEISFGDPRGSLVQLTPKLFDDIQVELDPIQRELLEHQYDFYHMKLPVSLFPERGAQFQALECRLDFGPKGDGEPVIYSIFPETQWRTVLQAGGSLDLALDGHLQWEAAIPADKIKALTGLGGVPSAKIRTKDDLRGYVVVPDFSFRVAVADILATGQDNSWCRWRLQGADLREQATVPFVVIFKVLKGTEHIQLSGICAAEPRISWIRGILSNIYGGLPVWFKRLLKKRDEDRQGQSRLPIGGQEEWDPLELPRRKVARRGRTPIRKAVGSAMPRKRAPQKTTRRAKQK